MTDNDVYISLDSLAERLKKLTHRVGFEISRQLQDIEDRLAVLDERQDTIRVTDPRVSATIERMDRIEERLLFESGKLDGHGDRLAKIEKKAVEDFGIVDSSWRRLDLDHGSRLEALERKVLLLEKKDGKAEPLHDFVVTVDGNRFYEVAAVDREDFLRKMARGNKS